MSTIRNLDPDKAPLYFGKYQGKTPNEIADIDPSYIVWLFDQRGPNSCTKDLADLCRESLEEQDESEESDLYDDITWGRG